MAKTVAPLLSFDAGGQIAKTQVYSRWKGRSYVRRYVVPANPNSTGQQAVRGAFSWLMKAWKFWPASSSLAWTLYGDNLRITNRNAFAKLNVPLLKGQTAIDTMIISPSAGSGLVAQGMTVTPGDDQLTVALAAPVLPTGWAIVSAYAMAIPTQDPTTTDNYNIVSGDDASSPYSIVLTGLASATEYLVGGWFEFTKTNGAKAYGQALQDTATTT